MRTASERSLGTTSRRVPAGSDRARKIGEHQPFGAVRDLRKDERSSGLQQCRR